MYYKRHYYIYRLKLINNYKHIEYNYNGSLHIHILCQRDK